PRSAPHTRAAARVPASPSGTTRPRNRGRPSSKFPPRCVRPSRQFYPAGTVSALNMNVRDAQESDFARVTELLENDGRPRIPHAEYTEYREAYVQRLDHFDTTNLVAVDDGLIVGFCSIQFRHRFNHMRPEAWIADLVVEPTARGRGEIGRAHV